jgi:putative transposase
MNKADKNKIISESISATRKKRKSQICKTFRFKVDKKALTREQKDALKMFFVEAKYVYNYILGSKSDPFSISYKELRHIKRLDKDRNELDYDIKYIGSSVISDIITIMKDSIKGLSSKKKKGGNVGGLRFKSECNSIRLRQYGITHYIKGNRFKIQGIKKPIKVNGLKQLSGYKNIDYTVAHLLYDGYDYFISLTCFIDKPISIKKINNDNNNNDNIIGLDFGCKSTITLSNGGKIKVEVEESKRLKGLQSKLATQTKHSNNYNKTKSLIRKEYNRIANKKRDISNKIVHSIVSEHDIVVIQDDSFEEWHKSKGTSKTVQHSVLGRIKSRLIQSDNVIVLDKWFPTTKHCFGCGNDINIELNERTFKCPICGLESDRDVHAANNMIEFYKRIKPVGTTGSMPGRKISYNSCKGLFEQEAPLHSSTE